ncbi:MAG: HAD hydrolase-like protein, partial [Bacteroidales bacterium]|nr:HAD hydrolase-like protein [Bacteroidales bacterium]
MKLIIFDLDGTIINSLSDLAIACNYVMKHHGYPE